MALNIGSLSWADFVVSRQVVNQSARGPWFGLLQVIYCKEGVVPGDLGPGIIWVGKGLVMVGWWAKQTESCMPGGVVVIADRCGGVGALFACCGGMVGERGEG